MEGGAEKEGRCGGARTRNEVDRRVCCPRGFGPGPHCCRLWLDQGWRAIFVCVHCVCVCGSPGWQCKLIARLPQFVAASVSLAFSTLRSQMTLTLTLIAAAGDATNATIKARSQQDRRKKDLPQQTLRYPASPLLSYQRGTRAHEGICMCPSQFVVVALELPQIAADADAVAAAAPATVVAVPCTINSNQIAAALDCSAAVPGHCNRLSFSACCTCCCCCSCID